MVWSQNKVGELLISVKKDWVKVLEENTFVEFLLCETRYLMFSLIDLHKPWKYGLLTSFYRWENRGSKISILFDSGSCTFFITYCLPFCLLSLYLVKERKSQETWEASFYAYFRNKRGKTETILWCVVKETLEARSSGVGKRSSREMFLWRPQKDKGMFC